jgi:hypothetical protein
VYAAPDAIIAILTLCGNQGDEMCRRSDPHLLSYTHFGYGCPSAVFTLHYGLQTVAAYSLQAYPNCLPTLPACGQLKDASKYNILSKCEVAYNAACVSARQTLSAREYFSERKYTNHQLQSAPFAFLTVQGVWKKTNAYKLVRATALRGIIRS